MKKTIAIGITGGIAAYKICELVSRLSKQGFDVQVMMTKNATEFITPLTLETLSKNRVIIDTFDRNFQYDVAHISVAKKADLFVVAPASANVIAKLACGICDDFLTTTYLACNAPKLICPAMNSAMYLNPVTQKNLQTLKGYGANVLEPASGLLACNDIGVGRLAEIDDIYDQIISMVNEKPLLNKKVLITAGATREVIDKVRFITNYSTGKMGYALAYQASLLGANVTLVSANTSLKKSNLYQTIDVSSANEMFEVIKELYQDYDYIIKAAAVSDYTITNPKDYKTKKNMDLELNFTKTVDILAYLGNHRINNQIICGFAMESENEIANAQLKLTNKKADMIVVNNLNTKGAGFATDTNVVSLISKNQVENLEIMSKHDLAKIILLKLKEMNASDIITN